MAPIRRRRGRRTARRIVKRTTRNSMAHRMIIRRPIRSRVFMPSVKNVRLKWFGRFNVNPTAGAVATYDFSCNNAFAPDSNFSAHQPMGWDQLTPLYGQYIVVSSTITITVFNPDLIVDLIVGIKRDDNAAVPTTVTTLVEQPNFKYKTIAGNSGGNAKATIRMGYSVAKATPKGFGNSEYGALTSGGPIEERFFNVCVMPVVNSDDPNQVNGIAMIIYNIRFFDRKDLGGS